MNLPARAGARLRAVFLPACRASLSLATLVVLTFVSVPSRADIVADWNDTLTQLSAAVRTNPAMHLEARVYALTHLAMEEALAAATREQPAAIGDDAVASAAAGSAAATMLASLFPRRAADFETRGAALLAHIPEGAAKQRGIELGRAAAAGVLRKRETDQWLELTLPGRRDPASEGGPAALFAPATNHPPETSPWLQATPFVLKRANQFRAEPLFDILFDGEVVLNVRLTRARIFDSVDRRTPADVLQHFWSERPVAAWNRIARSFLADRALDLRSRARVLAALNLALADAALAANHWRHVYALGEARTTGIWVATDNPGLAEREAFVDEGLRSTMVRQAVARIVSPPARNFPAGAAAVAGAAQAVLKPYLRMPAGECVLTAPGAAESRRFADLNAAAAECAFAASLDGQHSREACVSGFLLGADIGGFVAKRVGTGR